MRRPASLRGLEALGRVQLSRHFQMRTFLHSEIAALHGLPNIPDDPDLAIAAGTRLATDLLDPIVETFGPVMVRGAYRSAAVNAFGNARGMNCARTEAAAARHVWDRRDAAGRMGATACIVVPWFAAGFPAGRDWRDLAWWLHDHLPFSEIGFFPIGAAFNIGWHEAPRRRITSYVAPRGTLLAAGATPPAGRAAGYAGFPPFRGLALAWAA